MLKNIIVWLISFLASEDARKAAIEICLHLASKTDNDIDDVVVKEIAKILKVKES